MSESKRFVVETLMVAKEVIDDLRSSNPKYIYSPKVISDSLGFETSNCNWFLAGKDTRFITNLIDTLLRYPDNRSLPAEIVHDLTKHDQDLKSCTFDEELSLANKLLWWFDIHYEFITRQDGEHGVTWFMIHAVRRSEQTAKMKAEIVLTEIYNFIEGYAKMGELTRDQFDDFRQGFLTRYNSIHQTAYIVTNNITSDTLSLLNDLLLSNPVTREWNIAQLVKPGEIRYVISKK